MADPPKYLVDAQPNYVRSSAEIPPSATGNSATTAGQQPATTRWFSNDVQAGASV
ncbi:unnamed protein product [Strongylus vulgaris]|uniref:Uncharacterized protein n=1 Tax=Strongylus vulgaris TaxID=40348 RepID=A0A3P7LP72_STRVU|nr:unnamed protein product [Strongylus vulgaris]